MKIRKKIFFFALLSILIQSISVAQEKDVEGSQDYPLLSRMQNFYISGYKMFDYESHEFYDAEDNEYVIGGKKWIIEYTLKEGFGAPGQLKVRKNYIDEVIKMDGSILFEEGLYMKITQADKEIWIDIWVDSDGSDYRLTIVEKEAADKEFEKTAEPEITGQPKHAVEESEGPEVQRVRQALATIKKNRSAALSTFEKMKQNAELSFALICPNEPTTPSAPGPIPVPYPNMSFSKDAAKGSKTVIVERSKMIAKKSEITKSEGDEIGTSIKKLSDRIQSRYKKGDLNEMDKTEYKEKLISYMKKAKLLIKTFDRYVEDVEKMLKILQRS